MPVKDKAAYGPGWKEFSARIRFERAGGRCECTGQCGTGAHGQVRCEREHRKNYPSPRYTSCESTCILTVAHLCHDPGCRDEGHVRAMCQACHLAYDRQLHSTNASATAKRKRLAHAPELPFAAGARA